MKDFLYVVSARSLLPRPQDHAGCHVEGTEQIRVQAEPNATKFEIKTMILFQQRQAMMMCMFAIDLLFSVL